MKDRLSIHLDNGQANVREAVTVLRNGGTPSQSGLVGITNAAYDPDTGSALIPDTIFNVQSTGDSTIRFSSGPSKDYRSSLELLGVGNTRASGLHISYDPFYDNAYIDADSGYGTFEPCVNPGVTDKTVVDFSMIRPSGKEGMEFSHISLSEQGYVSIGLTRVHQQRHFEANAPLTIAYACDNHQDSGTISIHEQASAPTTHSNFGKLYVKPYTIGGKTQAIYFKDDGGNETNLVLNQDIQSTNSKDGLIYGDSYGNTYGGWYSLKQRIGSNDLTKNTTYGFGAGFDLSDSEASCNTVIGYRAGSGITDVVSQNTVVGCDSYKNLIAGSNNTIFGASNLANGGGESGPSDVILIGKGLFESSLPEDGELAIGIGQAPLIGGKVTGSSKFVSINDAYLQIVGNETGDAEVKVSLDFDGDKFVNTIDTVDNVRNGATNPQSQLDFNFSNEDGHGLLLLSLSPLGTYLTNSKSYAVPSPARPYAELEGDLRIRGAIRFSDGTSLDSTSGLGGGGSPLSATDGIRKYTSGGTDVVVLDFSSLDLAGEVSSDITDENTFVAVQLNGSSSTDVGKMSLQGLSEYISSGVSAVSENCNVLIVSSDNRQDVNTSALRNNVILGCEAGAFASGWVNSVMIGNGAGSYAKTPNGTLDTDSASVFIGYRAGFDLDSAYRTVCIGNSAGENANGSQDSIFIGSSAGSNSNYDKSIGIGRNALGSLPGTTNAGSGNLEIYIGGLDNQRLFSAPVLDANGEPRGINDRMNIQNSIAGRTDRKNISIGDARLSPESPLEVRRDSVTHGSNDNEYIQSWFCDDVIVAAMTCDGNIIKPGEGEDREQYIEGFIQSTDNGMGSPNTAAIDAPTSGILRVYEDGVATDKYYYIKNRDSSLFVETGSYVIATLIRDDYRPMWVSC